MDAVHFGIPGDPATLTGGYLYDRHIIGGLRALGIDVSILGLDASFPQPTATALAAAASRFAALPARAHVVIDGLALPGLADVLAPQRSRLALIGLIHHPVALEPGIDPARARTLERNERAAFATLDGLICTSPWTARLLETYGIDAVRIRTVPPGTPRAPRARGSGSATPNLLCVGTVTPRKGHGVLIDALAPLRDAQWHLHCVGSLTRDPACAAAVRARIAAHGLGRRITLHGECADHELEKHYAAADVFVSASQLEGYGMAVAEALARGLPVVTTRAGAVPDWVPADAALLVAPDDRPALTAALGTLLASAPTRAALGERARAAGRALPEWPDVARRFAAALASLARA